MPIVLIELVVLFIAFGILAWVCACNPRQPRFIGRDLVDNALYWFLAVLLYGGAVDAYIHAGASLAAPGNADRLAAAILSGYGPASRLPIAVQALLIIVSIDFVQYWVHRLFHGQTLWPFHAIHLTARRRPQAGPRPTEIAR